MSNNSFDGILQTFRDLYAEASNLCIRIGLLTFRQTDVDAIPAEDEERFDSLFPGNGNAGPGFRGIGYAFAGGKAYYICGLTRTDVENTWLLSFRTACAKAGATLPKATREALSVPTRDPVDYWLTFMWQTVPPSLKRDKETTCTWSDGSEFRFLLAWAKPVEAACDAIELSSPAAQRDDSVEWIAAADAVERRLVSNKGQLSKLAKKQLGLRRPATDADRQRLGWPRIRYVFNVTLLEKLA